MSIIEYAKDIISGLRKIGDIKLFEENTKLKEQVKNLNKKLTLKGRMEFDGVVYKLDGKGYYCPKCYDDEGKPINLTFYTQYNDGTCPKCKNSFHHIPGKPSMPNQFHEHKTLFR